jgi:hypothetical protein
VVLFWTEEKNYDVSTGLDRYTYKPIPMDPAQALKVIAEEVKPNLSKACTEIDRTRYVGNKQQLQAIIEYIETGFSKKPEYTKLKGKCQHDLTEIFEYKYDDAAKIAGLAELKKKCKFCECDLSLGTHATRCTVPQRLCQRRMWSTWT